MSDNLTKEILPVYIISGNDSFLIQKAISQFKKSCILEYEELNYDQYDDDNFNAQNIINSCNGLPFCNAKKLVVVRGISKLNKDDEKMFQSYLSNPNATTCLVLVSDEKLFQDVANIEKVDCSTLGNESLQKMIAHQFKKQNKTIALDAANLLITKCEGDAMKITNEITKLSFLDKSLITKDLVDEIVANSFNLDIFKLSNALAEKNSDAALNILTNLLNAKTEPTAILSANSNSFRRMFLSSISTNQTNEELAKILGVKPFAITKAKENAKKFSVKTLKKINELLTQTDFMIKSGQMSAVNSVYFLIFNILIL